MTLGDVGWKGEEDRKLGEMRSNILSVKKRDRVWLEEYVVRRLCSSEGSFPHEQKRWTPFFFSLSLFVVSSIGIQSMHNVTLVSDVRRVLDLSTRSTALTKSVARYELGCGILKKPGTVRGRDVQLHEAFLKGLGRAQIHLSSPYILWHFSPKGLQEHSRNGAGNLQHALAKFIGGSKTKHVQRDQRVIIFERKLWLRRNRCWRDIPR